MEKVSIVVPLYKNERYIRETMNSIMNIPYKNIEIIVVDDCGNDGSLEICKELARKSGTIKILQNTRNFGTAKTILNGILEASGSYIFVAAADDIFMNNRIPDCLKIFHTESPFLIFADAFIIDESGKDLDLVYTNNIKVNNKNIIIEQFKRNQCLGATMAFANDKNLFKKYGNELFNLSDDFGFTMECIVKGLPIYYLRKPIIKYRIHDSNQSKDKSKMNSITKEILMNYLLADCEDKHVFFRSLPIEEFQIAKAIQHIYLREIDLAKSLLESISDLKCNQGLWEKYFYLSVIEYQSNNITQCYYHLKKSFALNKDHAATLNNMGVIEYATGSQELAKHHFKSALILKTDYIDSKINLQLIKDSTNHDLLYTKRTVFDQLMSKEKYANYFSELKGDLCHERIE